MWQDNDTLPKQWRRQVSWPQQFHILLEKVASNPQPTQAVDSFLMLLNDDILFPSFSQIVKKDILPFHVNSRPPTKTHFWPPFPIFSDTLNLTWSTLILHSSPSILAPCSLRLGKYPIYPNGRLKMLQLFKILWGKRVHSLTLLIFYL